MRKGLAQLTRYFLNIHASTKSAHRASLRSAESATIETLRAAPVVNDEPEGAVHAEHTLAKKVFLLVTLLSHERTHRWLRLLVSVDQFGGFRPLRIELILLGLALRVANRVRGLRIGFFVGLLLTVTLDHV